MSGAAGDERSPIPDMDEADRANGEPTPDHNDNDADPEADADDVAEAGSAGSGEDGSGRAAPGSRQT